MSRSIREWLPKLNSSSGQQTQRNHHKQVGSLNNSIDESLHVIHKKRSRIIFSSRGEHTQPSSSRNLVDQHGMPTSRTTVMKSLRTKEGKAKGNLLVGRDSQVATFKQSTQRSSFVPNLHSGVDESMLEQISIEDNALEEIMSKNHSKDKDSAMRSVSSEAKISRNLKPHSRFPGDTNVSRSFDSSEPINIER